MSRTQVVCAGIVVADLFVPPMDALPGSGELLLVDDFLLTPGGCAPNVACALARSGITASVYARTGEDAFGAFIAADLARRGVDASGLRASRSSSTSQTVILPVRGDDRRFIHSLGANREFRVSDVDRDAVRNADVLYVGGFMVLPAVEASDVAELFTFARSCGTRTVLDVVVPAGGVAGSDGLWALLPHVDVFLPNDDEAQALTGSDDPNVQARRLRDGGAAMIAITMGADGTLFSCDDVTFLAPAPSIDVVDGSGAGDAFAAGFITGLLEGWGPAECVRYGSALGASACTRLGCVDGVFTRDDALRFIKDWEAERRE